MYGSETGTWVLTEEELAQLFGSTNRQAVDGHMKGFREADMLAYVKGKRNVDDEVTTLVWQVFCVDPYGSLSE